MNTFLKFLGVCPEDAKVALQRTRLHCRDKVALQRTRLHYYRGQDCIAEDKVAFGFIGLNNRKE